VGDEEDQPSTTMNYRRNGSVPQLQSLSNQGSPRNLSPNPSNIRSNSPGREPPLQYHSSFANSKNTSSGSPPKGAFGSPPPYLGFNPHRNAPSVPSNPPVLGSYFGSNSAGLNPSAPTLQKKQNSQPNLLGGVIEKPRPLNLLKRGSSGVNLLSGQTSNRSVNQDNGSGSSLKYSSPKETNAETTYRYNSDRVESTNPAVILRHKTSKSKKT
jgi:hypothetical protein